MICRCTSVETRKYDLVYESECDTLCPNEEKAFSVIDRFCGGKNRQLVFVTYGEHKSFISRENLYLPIIKEEAFINVTIRPLWWSGVILVVKCYKGGNQLNSAESPIFAMGP